MRCKFRNIRVLVALVFLSNTCMPAINKAFAENEGSVKRNIAVFAFSPAMTTTDNDLMRTAVKEITKTERFYVVKDDEVRAYAQGYVEKGDKKMVEALNEAIRLLGEGKGYYDRLQFGDAIKTLHQALKRYHTAYEFIKDASDVLRALIYLGMAYVGNGDLEKGKKYITDAIRLDPERKTRKLSESQFPPDIRAIYQARQEVVTRITGGKLNIVASPPDATLYIDGFKVSQLSGSYAASGLPVGRHFVMLEKPGYARFYKQVTVGGEELTVNALMDKWDPFAEVPVDSITDEKKDHYRRLSDEIGADVLFLGSLKQFKDDQYSVTGQFFDARTESFSRVEEASFNKLGRSSKYLSKVISNLVKGSLSNSDVIAYSYQAEIPPIAHEEEQPVYEEKKGGSIFGKWWFWTIIGAATISTGSVLMFTDLVKKDPDYNLLKVQK